MVASQKGGSLRNENFINFEGHSTDCDDCIDFFCIFLLLVGEVTANSGAWRAGR